MAGVRYKPISTAAKASIAIIDNDLVGVGGWNLAVVDRNAGITRRHRQRITRRRAAVIARSAPTCHPPPAGWISIEGDALPSRVTACATTC